MNRIKQGDKKEINNGMESFIVIFRHTHSQKTNSRVIVIMINLYSP